MNDLNSVLLEGRLTKDPDLKYMNNGTALCQLSLAVNRRWKQNNEDREEVSFVEVYCWGKLGETCQQYLVTGRGVRGTGRLKQDRWESKEGQKREKVTVVADQVEFKPQPKEASDG